MSDSEREGSLTYLHGGNSAPQSVSRLQKFEVSEAILSQVTGGRQSSDASSDDDELVVILRLLLRFWCCSHQVAGSREVLVSRVLLFPVSDILSVQLRGQTVEAREVARAAETAFLGSHPGKHWGCSPPS